MTETIRQGGMPNWVPPCNDEIYAAEATACAQQIAAGIMPELPNGFTLVFDPVEHDDPYFDGYVTAEQYTAHIASRQIVVALPGKPAHKHDVNHIPTYQRLLSHASYAELTQLAATNSVGDPALSELFA